MVTRITNLDTEKIGHILWRLNKPLLWATSNGMITVPTNFLTDGASCPNILWSLCSPMSGPQVCAAVAHDYLYSKDCGLHYTREQADQLFYDMMIVDGTPKWRAKLIYMGVRAGGKKSFKKCHSLDKIKE